MPFDNWPEYQPTPEEVKRLYQQCTLIDEWPDDSDPNYGSSVRNAMKVLAGKIVSPWVLGENWYDGLYEDPRIDRLRKMCDS